MENIKGCEFIYWCGESFCLDNRVCFRYLTREGASHIQEETRSVSFYITMNYKNLFMISYSCAKQGSAHYLTVKFDQMYMVLVSW